MPLTGALAGGDSFTLTAKGFASTFDEKQIDAANRTLNVQHRFVTGQEVVYQRFSDPGVALGDAGTGLADGTTYFVIRVSDETIKLATTRDNARDGMAHRGHRSGHTESRGRRSPNRYMLVAADPSPAYRHRHDIRHRPVQVRRCRRSVATPCSCRPTSLPPAMPSCTGHPRSLRRPVDWLKGTRSRASRTTRSIT